MKRKIQTICLLMLFLFIFVGCNKIINICFVIEDETLSVSTNYNSIVSSDLIPNYPNYDIEGLYYDQEYTILYDDKPIKENISIYVKTRVKVNFIIDDIEKEVIINYGESITDELIPNYINYHIIGMYYDHEFTSLYNNEEIKENTNIYVKAIIKKQVNDSEVSILNNNVDSTGDIVVWNMEQILNAFKNSALDIYTFIPDMETKKYIAGYKKSNSDNQIEWYEYKEMNEDIKNIDGLILVGLYIVIDGELISNSMKESLSLKGRYYYQVRSNQELNIYDKCCLWSYSINQLEEIRKTLDTNFYPLICSVYDTLHTLYKQISINNNDYYKVVEKTKDLETGEVFEVLEYLSGENYEYVNEFLIKSDDSYVEDNIEYYWGYLDIKKIVESFK